jgi:peptidoglycan/xylan/chitin deacetylase (PgdA/CDA1 family)
VTIATAAGLLCGALFAGSCAWIALALRQELRRDRVPALLYHRFVARETAVSTQTDASGLRYATFADTFAAQMDWLRRAGYTTISVDDFLAYLDGRAPLPPRPILITCDDGFASNFRHAFPEWMKHGMTATIFVTADPASPNFVKYGALDAPLSDSQIADMSGAGIAIESHGMTHRYLSMLPDDEVLWELGESRRRLEQATGKPVRVLAIPGGAYDRRVRRLAQEAGYFAVFCMLKGTNNRDSDRFALRRQVVGLDFTVTEFARLLAPFTCCQMRAVSGIHDLCVRVVGPRRFDALQGLLERAGIRRLLAPGSLRWVMAGALALLAAGAALLLIDRWR